MALLVALGCGRASSPAPSEDEPGPGATDTAPRLADGVVTIPLGTAIVTYDPAEATDAGSRRLVAQLFDTLVDWAPTRKKWTLVPELATALPELDDDRLVMTFRLRTGEDAVRFADDPCFADGIGRSVFASDVRASLLRHADPTRAGFPLLAGRIENLAAAGKGSSDASPGIEVDDAAGTIRLKLTRPQPELPSILANAQMGVVPPECVAYYDGKSHAAFREHPVGSGPYILDHARSEHGRRAVLKRRPNLKNRPYPEAGAGAGHPGSLPGLAEIQFEYIRAPDTALRLFQNQQLALLSPGQSQFAEIFRDGKLLADAVPPATRVQKTVVPATTLLMFRMDDPTLGRSKDPATDREHRALRRAISVAFDTERYHAVVRNGTWATPARRLVPPSLSRAPVVGAYPFAPTAADVKKARSILEEAGLSGRTWKLRYMTTDGEDARQEAAILREALLPIGVELETVFDARYVEKIVLADKKDALAQMFALRFDADYPDPENFLRAMTCTGDLARLSHHCDPAYDQIFARYIAAAPGPERFALANELETHLGSLVPFRPVDHPQLWQLEHATVHGVVRHPVAGLRAELLYVDGR